ncbi:hypothetical protein BDZ91DRAFT_814672 [Kalaharituber pfeilii]|nr:hypothetical protein BDZ91DRAFT_814672 [Kalaharituber pfeilii]
MAFAVRPPRSALVTGKLRLSGHRASAGTGARAQHGGTVIRGGKGKELKFSLNWQNGGGLRLENGMGGSREEDLEQKCGLSAELKAEGAHRVFLLKVCLRSPKAVERTARQTVSVWGTSGTSSAPNSSIMGLRTAALQSVVLVRTQPAPPIATRAHAASCGDPPVECWPPHSSPPCGNAHLQTTTLANELPVRQCPHLNRKSGCLHRALCCSALV